MCKICTTCKSIMNYDPYFTAYVCVKCGKMDRKKSKEAQKVMDKQKQRAEIERRIWEVMVAH